MIKNKNEMANYFTFEVPGPIYHGHSTSLHPGEKKKKWLRASSMLDATL